MGHNRGNDSPSRNVPRVPGGANPVEEPDEVGVKVPTFGSPIGVEEVSDADKAARLREREAKLATVPEPGAGIAAVEEDLQASAAETRRNLEREADDRKAGGQEEEGTDLSAYGAARTIQRRRNPQTPGR
jgi:hypothetical protein